MTVLHEGQHSGEFIVTAKGVEGSGVYALASRLREAIARDGQATLMLDLAPDRSAERLAGNLSRPRDKASFANFLRKVTGIDGVKAALLRIWPLLPFSVKDDTSTASKSEPFKLRKALTSMSSFHAALCSPPMYQLLPLSARMIP